MTMLFGTVLCLGDSLVFGARSPLGFPERLAPLLSDDGVEWVAVNRGVSGETTRQILDRAPSAIGWLAGLAGAKWVVVLAGTNDAKGGGLAPDDWETLYRQVLHWPRRYGIPVALCTYPPVRPGQMPAFTKESRTWLRARSSRIRDLVVELDCRPSPVRLVDLEDLPVELVCDGVHLTPAGYAEVARRVAVVLRADEPAEVVPRAPSTPTPTPTSRPFSVSEPDVKHRRLVRHGAKQ